MRRVTCPDCAAAIPLARTTSPDEFVCPHCDRRFRIPATDELEDDLPEPRRKKSRRSSFERGERRQKPAKRPWWNPVPDDYGPKNAWLFGAAAAGVPLYLLGQFSTTFAQALMVLGVVVAVYGMMRGFLALSGLGEDRTASLGLLVVALPIVLFIYTCIYPKQLGKHFLLACLGVFWMFVGYSAVWKIENKRLLDELKEHREKHFGPEKPPEPPPEQRPPPTWDHPPPPEPKPLFANGPRIYLADLEPFAIKPGPWPFKRDGTVGDRPDHKISVQGVASPKGLGGMHPPEFGFVAVKYRLGKQAAVFKAKVGITDHAFGVHQPGYFEVIGDGQRLWRSDPVGVGPGIECVVDIEGVDILELRVTAPGTAFGQHAVWMEPRLLKTKETRDE
jgi:hypothetical protein